MASFLSFLSSFQDHWKFVCHWIFCCWSCDGYFFFSLGIQEWLEGNWFTLRQGNLSWLLLWACKQGIKCSDTKSGSWLVLWFTHPSSALDVCTPSELPLQVDCIALLLGRSFTPGVLFLKPKTQYFGDGIYLFPRRLLFNHLWESSAFNCGLLLQDIHFWASLRSLALWSLGSNRWCCQAIKEF